MKLKIGYPFKDKQPITFKFGASPDWYKNIAGYPHNGIDFGLLIGTAVLACDDGTIRYADNVPDADGLGINIEHKWGISQYWHLSKLSVNLGQRVKKGELIGYSGDTGWVTGPHLHFGIKVRTDPASGMRGWTNPMKYLEPVDYLVGKPLKKDRFYRVKLGDSLWKIAEKFYGKGHYWSRIYLANKDKIISPGLIFPFQKLRIP